MVGAVVCASPLWYPLASHKLVVTEYATAIGMRKTLRLTDGSRLVLNTDTRIAIFRDGLAFHVELKRGEILCDLQENPARRFVLSAGRVRITDLGTAFLVRLTEHEMRIAVQKGRVSVSGQGLTETSIAENQRAYIDRSGQHPVVDSIASEQLTRYVLWQIGLVEFVDERLSVVVEEINRYNRTKIEILDDHTANLRLTTGRLDPTDPAHFVKRVEEAGKVKWGIRQNSDGTTVLTLKQAS